MKSAIIAVATTLLVTTAARSEKVSGVFLRDPKSGSAVMLPAGWEFAAGRKGMTAASRDQKARILLAAVEAPFEQAAKNPGAALGLGGLEVTEIGQAMAVAEDKRGGFGGALGVRGKGRMKSGPSMDFEALIVTAGEAVAVAAGCWEDEADKATVVEVLDSLRIDLPKGRGGLQLYDRESGASIQVPDGWDTFASRAGLLAIGPDRSGMTMILRPSANFAKTLEATREKLRERVFTDIQLGEFAPVAAGSAGRPEGFSRVVVASGKAVDRGDGKPVGFEVLVAGEPEEDRGLMILGAWKSEEDEVKTRKMLRGLRLKRKGSSQTN